MLIIENETCVMKYYDFRSGKFKRILRRSFAKGIGSVVSVSGGYYTMQLPQRDNDVRYIASDWRRVGKQLDLAAQKVKQMSKK